MAGEPRLAGETGRAGEARSDLAPTFTIARNPEPGSKLPYLLRLPLREGPLLLKAADTWPRTSKVYCHPAESWPDSPEIVQEVPVRVCRRLGVAIDLVLDRPRKPVAARVHHHPRRPAGHLLAVSSDHSQGSARGQDPGSESLRP